MIQEAGIVIVGAGPTGLVAAIELARRGIVPRIVEKRSGPVPQSRALGINARSLALLEPSGVTPLLLAKGHRVRHLTLHAPDRTLASISLADIGGSYPFILSLPQGEVEALLVATLERHGVKVEWQTEVSGLDQQEGGAVVTLEGPDGRAMVEAGTVIGADGANSFVRKAVGLSFAGSAYETDWGLADARIETGLSLDGVNVFDLSPGLFAVIPMGGDLVRLVRDQPDVLGRVPEALRINEILWQSRFRIAHRQVETYQSGCVFLAGDAAHVHSPLGARGMNLGMEDAAWLAWLIAENDTARYSQIRKPVGRGVLAAVDPATRLMSSDGALARFVRRRVFPALTAIGPLRRRALRQMSGLGAPNPPWL